MQRPLCRMGQPFPVLRNASQGGRKQRLTVAIRRMVNVQTSSDAAPPLPENIGSAVGFTIRQKPFWGCSQKAKSLCTAACSACWQSIRVSTDQEESTAVLLLPNTPFCYVDISTIFGIQSSKWDLENH